MAKKKLSEFAQVIMGQSPKGATYNKENKGLPLLNGAADFNKKGIFPKQFTTQPTKRSQKGDILLCIRATIGNAIISDGEYCLGRGVAAIRINKNIVETKFALYLIEQKVLHLAHRALGSTIIGIKKNDLDDLEFDVPSIKAQKEIVLIIEKAENLKKNREETNEDSNKIIQSVFYEMFGDPIKNEKGWAKNMLGNLINITSSKRIFQQEYVKEGVPFYRTKEIVELSKNKNISLELFISNERFAELKEKFGIPKKGDILLSAVGTIGISWVVSHNEDFYFKDGNLLWFKQSKKLNSVYLKHLLDYIFKYRKSELINGAAYDALTIIKMKNLNIICPPLPIQNQFAELVQKIESLKEKQRQSTEDINLLFDALMQRAFKGDLISS